MRGSFYTAIYIAVQCLPCKQFPPCLQSRSSQRSAVIRNIIMREREREIERVRGWGWGINKVACIQHVINFAGQTFCESVVCVLTLLATEGTQRLALSLYANQYLLPLTERLSLRVENIFARCRGDDKAGFNAHA